MGDNKNGRKTHLTGYIDNVGAMVMHNDSFFVSQYLKHTGPTVGCHLNRSKTRIFTSTSCRLALQDVVRAFRPMAALKMTKAIVNFSLEEDMDNSTTVQHDGTPLAKPKEIITDIYLLGQPITYFKIFTISARWHIYQLAN